MDQIEAKDILVNQTYGEGLYSLGGDLLVATGETISPAIISALAESGIELLVKISDDQAEDYCFRSKHTTVSISTLKVGSVIVVPLYNKDDILLLKKDAIISKAILDKFKQRNIKELYTLVDPKQLQTDQVDRFRTTILFEEGTTEESVEPIIGKPEISHQFEIIKNPGTAFKPSMIDRALENDKTQPLVKPVGSPLSLRLNRYEHKKQRSEAVKNDFWDTYLHLEKMTTQLFQSIISENANDAAHLRSLTSNIINAMLADNSLQLNLTNHRPNENYLINHAVRVTIVSVNIATSMGYSEKQVFELGCASLLADIGMFKVDQHLLSSSKTFNQLERLEIDRHVIHTLDFLQQMRGLAKSVPLIVYQVHERMDRSGYPKKRPAMLIHQFAKIIAVADIFDALCSERPYRKPFHPYCAMEMIIKMAGNKKVDANVVRAFLKYMSLFPIGSWVETTCGQFGKVIASNQNDFTKPILRLIYEQETLLKYPTIVKLNSETDIKIKRWCDAPHPNAPIMEGF